MLRFIAVIVTAMVISIYFTSCSHTTSSSGGESEISEPAKTSSVFTLTVAPKEGRMYANIRMNPSGSSPKVAEVPVGTELTCYTRSGRWYQVRVPDSMKLGWIKDIYFNE